MLFKLAFRNVRRQFGNYLIYFLTVVFTVALIYSLNTLIYSDVMDVLMAQLIDLIEPIAFGVSFVVAIAIAFVLGYVTRFLLNRRKKEFGLYLSLGMTRSNILVIFLCETAITFVISLGMGLLLGLGIYKIIAYLLVNFLDLELALAGYSATATALTVGMVAAMFAVASVASLSYLKFAKINHLLQSEQTVRKEPSQKSVTVWFCIFLAVLVVMIVDVSLLIDLILDNNLYWHLTELSVYIVLFILCTILLPMCFCKGLIGFLFRLKKFISRGTRRFSLRQLSAQLNGNAIMIGILSLFLAITFVVSNSCYAQKTLIAYENEQNFAYDFSCQLYVDDASNGHDEYNSPTIDKADGLLEVLSARATVTDSHLFFPYSAAHPKDYDPEGYENGLYFDYTIPNKTYYRESDFTKFCAMIGKTAPKLNGGYLIFHPDRTAYGAFDFFEDQTQDAITLDGKSYSCIGTITAYEYPWDNIWNDAIVVPDEAVEARELTPASYCHFIANFANNNFDARALEDEYYIYLYGEIGSSRFSSSLKYYHYLYELSGVGLMLFASMFVGTVFVLLTMATLALKTLSTLAEEKVRYRTLWKLGASESMVGKSLFVQMFYFFFMPLVMPLILCFPLASLLFQTSAQAASPLLVLQLAGFAGAILLIFALYFLITYLLSWHDLQRSIRSNS